MAFILNIDTAVENASVCLAQDAKPLQFSMNNNQRDHSSWMHPAIQKVMQDAGKDVRQLDAVAVTIGPGSYTGLRVGLSAAKGLCFALDIPLIGITTLEMMAFAVKGQAADLICPLIDARRNEVFTAVYDKDLNEIIPACAMVLDGKNFDALLNERKMIFSGNGSNKLKEMLLHKNASFSSTGAMASDMTSLTNKGFSEKRFADLAYVEPLYLKEFYSPTR